MFRCDLETATKLIKIQEIMNKENSNQKEKSNELYTLLPTVLDEMIKYIEETDQRIEWEWGSCRSLQEVKDARDMPNIYYKLIALRNGG